MADQHENRRESIDEFCKRLGIKQIKGSSGGMEIVGHGNLQGGGSPPSPEQNLFSLTDDGAEELDRLKPLLDGDLEFLMDGDGSDSPYHECLMAYYLRTSKSGRYFGLEVVDYGDPQVPLEEDVPRELSVVLENPEFKDLRRVSELLIRTYESSSSNKTIERIRRVGEIMRNPKKWTDLFTRAKDSPAGQPRFSLKGVRSHLFGLDGYRKGHFKPLDDILGLLESERSIPITQDSGSVGRPARMHRWKYFFEDGSFEIYAGNTASGEPRQGAVVSGIGAFRWLLTKLRLTQPRPLKRERQ